jgi:hypothetical protein
MTVFEEGSLPPHSAKIPTRVAFEPGETPLRAETKFVSNVSLESDPDNASAQCLFDLVGIPRPGGLRLEIKPSQRPKSDDLRAHLFPSMVAGAANERGYRLISREAFPMELVSNATTIKFEFWAGWTAPGGFRLSEKVLLRVFGFDPTQWLD